MGIRGVTKITDYQQEGLLMDISDYMLKSDLDLTAYGNMVYSYSIDDQYYGLPTRNTYWSLYYNKTLFDRAGLQYPGQLTWEEYAQLAKQLTTDGEGEDKIWGGYFINWIYYFAGVQRQNYLYDDDISDTMESLLWLNRFYNEDQSHMPLLDVIEIGDDYMRVFESGMVAMMPQGEWAAGWLHGCMKMRKPELRISTGISLRCRYLKGWKKIRRGDSISLRGLHPNVSIRTKHFNF